MAVGVARQEFGRWVSWVAGAVLLAGLGCEGTEQTIFSAIPPPPVAPPPARDPIDAGPAQPPSDAGSPAAPDAGEDLDASGVVGPELDPDVKFVWNESLPGQGTCKSGDYSGSFTCTPEQPDAAVFGPPAPVSGQLVFTLGELSEAQELPVTSGSIKDVLGGVLFHGGVRGALACRDDHFTGESVEGVIGSNAFEATLEGTFDPDALVIEGSFVVVDSVGARCEGDFHVTASP
jgi:hypothetical protein